MLGALGKGSGLLSDKLDTPEAVDADPNKQAKAEKDKKAADPLMNPENALTPENSQKQKAKEAAVKGADIRAAKQGDVVYHDQLGALTKTGKDQWSTSEGVNFPQDVVKDGANLGYLSREPWDDKQAQDKEDADAANKLVVDGKEIPTVNKFEENDRSEAIKADGGSTPPVFELEATPENAHVFVSAMKKSLEGNPYAASVYVYDEDDYAGMRLFLADDGKSGIALHDGDEIVSVFSDPKSKNKKVARHLISIAVENGGKRLDAFDTVLPGIYAKEGFQVKARLKWNDEYAPDGWDKETFSKFNNGEPDVVFMKHEPGLEDTDYEPGFGDYVEDYDAGLAATGGKAQDENDYRPESGDPDNDESEIETTPDGHVIPQEIHDLLAKDMKISAIVALKNANPGMTIGEAKNSVNGLINSGVRPGDKMTVGLLYGLNKDSSFEANGTVYTKNENNNWVTPNGGVFTGVQIEEKQILNDDTAKVVRNPDFKEKKVETPEEPADFEPVNPVPDEPFEPVPENGMTIIDVSGFQVGDTVNLQTEKGTITLKKTEDGFWEESKDHYVFSDEDLNFDADQGKLWIDTIATPEEEEAALLPPKNIQEAIDSDTEGLLDSEPVPTVPLKITYDGDNQFLKPAVAKQAIESLEAHSGFQVKYGLKSLPDDHPLKDEDYLNGYLADAKSNYSDLSPKAALIAQLKKDAGQEPLADWEKELLDGGNSKKVQIGTRSPKSTATGVTGGEFSPSDVQNAIDILENYDGKVFKNELNKKGNPLGKLSPNDIVGFNKDKTVTKQKFIDLLKKKIAPETPETVASKTFEPDNKDQDYSDVPETGKVVAADPDMNALQDAPVGSHVSWNPQFQDGKVIFSKEENGTWTAPGKGPKNSDAIFFYNSAMMGKLKWSDAPETSDVDESETNGEFTVGQTLAKGDGAKLPVGSVIATSSGATWHKTGMDQWKTISAEGNLSGSTYFDKDTNAFLIAGNGKLKSLTDDFDFAPKVSQPNEAGTNVTDLNQLIFAPIGTRIVKHMAYGTDRFYVKSPSGLWQNEKTGTYIPDSDFFQMAVNDGIVDIVSVPGPDNDPNRLAPGTTITNFETFKNLPKGSHVDAGHMTYTKQGDNQWKPDGFEDIYEDSSFVSGVTSGKIKYTGHTNTPEVADTGDTSPHIDEADTTLDSAVGAAFSQMKEYDKAVSILPAAERGENGDGFVVVHTDDGPKITWGKFGGGGIATVATDENGVKKVLIGKRGDRDEWYLPGGAIDQNETHLQGSLREFSEEVEDGQNLLDNIKIVGGYQATIGKIEGTDKDWKYVTSVAELPSLMNITAPSSSEPWELSEYQWFSADELAELDASGKLHSALGNGNLAKMVGFEEDSDLHSEILALLNTPDNLAEPKYDISDWKVVSGSQGGSNPGYVVADHLGNKFYVKSSNGGDNATHNEIVAGALYKAAGVKSNEVFLVTKDGNQMMASPWIENDNNVVPDIVHGGDSNDDFLKKAQADFAIDAWLDNYDVVGIGPWNLVADEDGNPLRLDPGGSMMFRATGSHKGWWSDEPTAIDDMRFGSNNSSAYTYLPNIFGSMTNEDVKESAKKLLDITPEQIKSIVESSGFDQDTKNKLQQTLIVRRQKILDRFGLSETPISSAKDYVSKSGWEISPAIVDLLKKSKSEDAIKAFQLEHIVSKEKAKVELMDFAMASMTGKDLTPFEKPKVSTAAFAKGTKVKIKGEEKFFDVELSNNEATAGMVDGKFLVFLNDELTTDTGTFTDSNYAFTADGQTFSKVEKVMIPDPANPTNQIQGSVLNADWSSGLVNVVVGPKVLQVDKTHIKKIDTQELPRLILPGEFLEPPLGSKPLATYKSENTTIHAIQHPDGTNWTYSNEGEKWQGSSNTEDYANWAEDVNTPNWSAFHLSGNPPVSGDVAEAGSYAKDMNGNKIAVGDNISIMKYNKGGFSKSAKIVSINQETGKAKVRRLDENGFPLTDENGKAVYATVSLSSLRKDTFTLSTNGLPNGIVYSEGDKSNALYGTMAPQPPVLIKPGDADADPVVGEDWLSRAEKAYAAYRVKKSLSAKSLQESATAWTPIQGAMKGNESQLETLKAKGYFDDDPALYEELQKGIDAQKEKYADLVIAHEKAVIQFQKDRAEWSAANGVASYTPMRHSDVPGLGKYDAQEWAMKNITGWKNVSNKSGFSTQKSSSYWQQNIRLLPAVLGMDRDDIANAPGVSAENMQVWDNIKEGADQAGPVGEAWRGVRSVDAERFVKPDGTRFNIGDDLKQMIGSIQKDHGAMEFSPGSWDKGAHSGYDVYAVEVDLVVPPEIKGIYTEGTNLPNTDGGENGFIAEPGLAMYIWDVFQDTNQDGKGAAGGRWVVKASLIPREVLPYMNNFEGDPMGHNLLIPGKDTTTGLPATPTVPSDDIPAVELNNEQLQSQPIGTVMQEISTAHGTVVNTWTKKAENKWVNGKGSSLNGLDLAGFKYKVTRNPSSVSPTVDAETNDYTTSQNSGKWTTDQLNALPYGATVKDWGGNTWRKVGQGTWINDSLGLSKPTTSVVSDFMVHPDDMPGDMADGTWSKQALDAQPLGKIVKDSNNASWKKIDKWDWENEESGEIWASDALVENAMDDPFMSLMSEPNKGIRMEKKFYTPAEIENMVIGSIVTDKDGDVWEKTGENQWTLVKQSSLAWLDLGSIRQDWAISGYTEGYNI
jgi:8-oxo-dGTP pyrophosphatase MutT (NUDIX family)